MTSLDSFPGPSGAADDLEAGKDLAGLVVRDAAGAPRAGVLGRVPASIVTARTDFKVDVASFRSVLVRSGAVRLSGNDGSVTVPAAPLSAPISNQKYAIVYQKQNETARGDASNTSVIDVVDGPANSSAATALANARGMLPAGALELATILIPSTATATNSAGVVITQTAPLTAASGGVLPFRTLAERDAFAGAPGQVCSVIGTNELFIRDDSSAWVSTEGDWIAFTPALTGMTLGNGSLAGCKYKKSGKLVFFIIRLTWGSTSSASGAIGFSAPVTPAGSYIKHVGEGVWTRTAIPGTPYPAQARIAGGTAITAAIFNSSGAVVSIENLSNTYPAAPATGDTLYLAGWYEEA